MPSTCACAGINWIKQGDNWPANDPFNRSQRARRLPGALQRQLLVGLGRLLAHAAGRLPGCAAGTPNPCLLYNALHAADI